MSADNYLYAVETSKGVFAVEYRYASSVYEPSHKGEVIATVTGERAVYKLEQEYGTEYGVQFKFLDD